MLELKRNELEMDFPFSLIKPFIQNGIVWRQFLINQKT